MDMNFGGIYERNPSVGGCAWRIRETIRAWVDLKGKERVQGYPKNLQYLSYNDS